MRYVQLVSPVLELSSVNGLHPTSGLAGYPAHDWFAPAGSIVIAPATGVVARLSGHPVGSGPRNGPHGAYGLSIYITDALGQSWFITHCASVEVRRGQRVRQGQRIGRVASWAPLSTPSHVHLGVKS